MIYIDFHQTLMVDQMKIQISKWGNSLALRLPVECVRATGLNDGDSVEATVTATGDILLSPSKSFDKKSFLDQLTALQSRLPVTTPVISDIRENERY